MAKQVVIPQDLHTDFDIGTGVANKISINIDGATIIRNGAGELEVSLEDAQVTSAFTGTTYLDGSTNVEDALEALDTAVAGAVAGIPVVPSTYNDEEIVTAGLPAPIATATNVEDALTGLANAVTTNASTELLENTFSNVTLGYIKP